VGRLPRARSQSPDLDLALRSLWCIIEAARRVQCTGFPAAPVAPRPSLTGEGKSGIVPPPLAIAAHRHSHDTNCCGDRSAAEHPLHDRVFHEEGRERQKERPSTTSSCVSTHDRTSPFSLRTARLWRKPRKSTQAGSRFGATGSRFDRALFAAVLCPRLAGAAPATAGDLTATGPACVGEEIESRDRWPHRSSSWCNTRSSVRPRRRIQPQGRAREPFRTRNILGAVRAVAVFAGKGERRDSWAECTPLLRSRKRTGRARCQAQVDGQPIT
jgi:hypothetical protein